MEAGLFADTGRSEQKAASSIITAVTLQGSHDPHPPAHSPAGEYTQVVVESRSLPVS